MAYMPTQNKIPYRIETFDGGLNTKFTDYNTPRNQSPSLQNVEFDDFGAVGTCLGHTKLTASSIASFPIDGLHEYTNNDGDRKLIAACGSDLHTYETTGWTRIASSTSMYSAGQDVAMVTVDNGVFITNGYATPMLWDGSTLTNVGPPEPYAGVAASQAVSAACSATGPLTGGYTYLLTGVNSRSIEGYYGQITSAAVTLTSGTMSLTNIPTFPASAGVSTKYIYRNKASAEGVYYRVTSVTNAVTSFSDNTIDSDISTAVPTSVGQMPPCKFLIYHKSRAFAAGNPSYPMRLYFSQKGDPEKWPALNYIDINEGDGAPITAISIYGNVLTIDKNNGKGRGDKWLLTMPDSQDVNDYSNWYLEKAVINQGAASHKAVALYSGTQFFLNKYAAFGFVGQGLAMTPAYSNTGQFPTDQLSFLIEPDVKDFRSTLLHKAAAINYDNKIWLAVAKGSGATTNNTMYVFDYQRTSGESRQAGAWAIRSKPYVNCFAEYDGSLYGGSAEYDGYVYKLNNGTNFDGSAIDSYYYTIWIHGNKGHEDNTKVWRYLRLWVETSGNWDLNVEYWLDFASGAGTTGTVSLASAGNRWDETLIWGTSTWGGGVNRKTGTIVFNHAVGKAIQFKFSTNAADQHFKIYRIELEYNLRSKR